MADNKVFVSPGVFTSERDLTFVAQQVGVTTLGLVGETVKGPAFEPVFISDYDEHQKFFGGLNAENVAEAIKHLSPFAVDISSGVETGGIKDHKKIVEFLKIVKEAK